MTTGNFVKDGTSESPYYVDGELQGTRPVGPYDSKNWYGGDAVKPSRTYAGKKRTYTTIDRRTGRTIKKVFYERSPKRASSRSPNYYSMSATRGDGDPFDYRNDYYIGSSSYTQVVTGYAYSAKSPLLPPRLDWSDNDEIHLINNLKERSRGSDFNMGVFLAEGHQTLNMITDSAIRIARAMRLVKRGNIVGAVHEMSKSASQTTKLRTRLTRKGLWSSQLRANATRQLSSNWLELVYGWLPLLGDIQSGSELLAHQLNVPFRQRVVARRSNHLDPSWNQYGNPLGGAEVQSLCTGQIVAYFSEPESIPKLLGLTDPASIAWEVTPFSFVADWVAPVGDYLEARGYASQLWGTFVVTHTTRQKWVGITGRSWKQDPSGVQHGITTVTKGGKYWCERIQMERYVTNTLNVPSPVVKPLSKVASWQHCVNAIALLGVTAKAVFK